MDVTETCSRLAGAATSDRPAAAAATTATTAAAAAPPRAAAAATAPAASTPPGGLFAGLSRCCVFLVEHIECRQADVGNLFLTEVEFVMRRGVLRRNVRRCSTGRRGCCTGHSK